MKRTWMRPAVPVLLALFAEVSVCATHTAQRPEADRNSMTDSFAPKPATAGDMKIVAPYIGTFRSPTQLFDDGKTEHHFLIKYEWFDRPKTIAKFTVSMVIPSQNRVLVTSEGFYGFDPFNDHLYVFGAFAHGMSGWGSMCEFDHATGARAVCAKSKSADGEWKQVHEGKYTRVASSPAP